MSGPRLDSPPAAPSRGTGFSRLNLDPGVAATGFATTGEGPDSLVALSAAIKTELRDRFARGERPEAREYLARFPRLAAHRDRVVSLAYEEFCLLEDHGEPADPVAFCDRYDTWRDSLGVQLRCHRELSQLSLTSRGEGPGDEDFPSPGDRIGGFELLSVLGRGGSGRVYLAREEALNRRVALKVSPARGEEPKIHARLEHPQIVPVLGLVDAGGGLRGLSMPYRPGPTLERLLARLDPATRPQHAQAIRKAMEGPPSVATGPGRETDGAEGTAEARAWAGFPASGRYADGVAWVGAALADALAHAHARGVLHRDVKPANVLLTRLGGPQLLDFNLAHDPLSARDEAEEALRGGTLPYMAPEHLGAFLEPSTWSSVGPTADLYSLGLVLVELLTGRRPDLPDPTRPLPQSIRALIALRSVSPEGPRDRNPDVPHALDAIIRKCLAPDPSERYPSAADLAEDLRLYLALRPPRHVANPSPWERAVNLARRHRHPLAAAVVLTLVAVLVGLINRKPTATAFADLGLEAMVQGRLDEAQRRSERALMLEPGHSQALRNLAALASRRGDLAESRRLFDQAISGCEREGNAAARQTLPVLLLDRAGVLNRMGRQALGRHAYDEARQVFLPALDDLRRASAAAGELDELGRVRLSFGTAFAQVGLGDVASASDQYEESVRSYQEARRSLARALELRKNDVECLRLADEINLRLATDEPKRGGRSAPVAR